MRHFRALVFSPFALGKAGLVGILFLTMLRFGAASEAALIGRAALLQACAMLAFAFIKFGSDVELVKDAAQPGADKARLRGAYAVALARRYVLCLPVGIALSYLMPVIEIPTAVAIVTFGFVLSLGNLLRVSVNPNVQLFYDATFLLLFIFYGAYLLEMNVDTVFYTFVSLHLLVTTLVVGRHMHFIGPQIRSATNFFYFGSELTIMLYTQLAVILLAVSLGDVQVGGFRAVERLAFAGTFLLFVANNRAFYDRVQIGSENFTLSEYIRRFSFPCSLFYLSVLSTLLLISITSYGIVLREHFSWFLMLAAGHFVSAAAGPVGTFLNVMHHERTVLVTNIIAVSLFASASGLAYLLDLPSLVIAGLALATAFTNFSQFIVLARLLSNQEQQTQS